MTIQDAHPFGHSHPWGGHAGGQCQRASTCFRRSTRFSVLTRDAAPSVVCYCSSERTLLSCLLFKFRIGSSVGLLICGSRTVKRRPPRQITVKTNPSGSTPLHLYVCGIIPVQCVCSREGWRCTVLHVREILVSANKWRQTLRDRVFWLTPKVLFPSGHCVQRTYVSGLRHAKRTLITIVASHSPKHGSLVSCTRCNNGYTCFRITTT